MQSILYFDEQKGPNKAVYIIIPECCSVQEPFLINYTARFIQIYIPIPYPGCKLSLDTREPDFESGDC